MSASMLDAVEASLHLLPIEITPGTDNVQSCLGHILRVRCIGRRLFLKIPYQVLTVFLRDHPNEWLLDADGKAWLMPILLFYH